MGLKSKLHNILVVVSSRRWSVKTENPHRNIHRVRVGTEFRNYGQTQLPATTRQNREHTIQRPLGCAAFNLLNVPDCREGCIGSYDATDGLG